MTSQELTIGFFERLKRYKYFIISASIICALIMMVYAMKTPVTYTSRATIFPLTGGNDNASASSTLSALFGGGGDSKSFTDEASVNIVELALSRTTREEVAAMKDTSRGNKTIAELLIDDINNHRSFLEPKIELPTDKKQLIIIAAGILKNGITASINKNNSFVLTYTGRSPDLVRTISYGFINKISKFYIDLKREKAKRDFEFATSKVDSLNKVINSKDNQLISIDQRTLFTNTSKMEFRVPTENLISDKEMLRQQYAVAVANQQNAAYQLQKATPVMKVLDSPDPPYDVQSKSRLIYGSIGFFIGLILSLLYSSFRLLFRYAKEEANKAIYGEETIDSNEVGTAA
ncbi:MAG TPA: Wzz/FepE/Etk N-terminal domain-containing protein [Hanamia sp.]|nr:Wzz/FepE/Etk N-terminal domain-containing protein [Hanamia sp.]